MMFKESLLKVATKLVIWRKPREKNLQTWNFKRLRVVCTLYPLKLKKRKNRVPKLDLTQANCEVATPPEDIETKVA